MNKKRNLSFILLGLFLLTGVGPHFGQILLQLFPKMKYFPTNFLFLSGVLFYLYSRSVLGVFSKKNLLHLIPGLIELLLNCVLFVYPEELGNLFYDKEKNPFLLLLYVYVIPIYCIFYAIKSILLINKYKTSIPKLYAIDALKRLNWIKITCYILIFANSFEAMNSLMVIKAKFAVYGYLFSAILSAFVFYWVSIYGLNQRNLFLSLVINDDEYDKNDDASATEDVKMVKEKPKPDEKSEEQFQSIIAFFKKTKIFKDKEINLFSVSDLLQMPYRDVSRLINNYGNKNFNQFINEFRIEEAKKLIIEDHFNKFNLSGIAEEVGFNSRSTFFAAFKAIVGMTPIEYKNAKKQELEKV